MGENLTFSKDKDLEFLDYIKSKYESSLSPSQIKYFKRDRERNISILSLFLGTGIRVNELSNLRIKDIDFTSKEISVIRKGNKKDTVSVTPSSMVDLQNYLTIRNERYKAGNGENEFVCCDFITEWNQFVNIYFLTNDVKRFSVVYNYDFIRTLIDLRFDKVLYGAPNFAEIFIID